MKINSTLLTTTSTLALLIACSTAERANPDGRPVADSRQSAKLELRGSYRLRSTFDISADLPGAAGTVINDFIDATDGPNDPTDYLLSLAIAQVPNATLQSLLDEAKDVTEAAINDQLATIAPHFLLAMYDLSNKFGQVARNFGLSTRLAVAPFGSAYLATHTMDRFFVSIDGVENDFTLADYQLPNVVVNGVGIDLSSTGELAIATHQMPVSYGAMLRIALDNAVVPLLDPSAYSLSDVFAHYVDCEAFGATVANSIGVGDASIYQTACSLALQTLAAEIYAQLDSLNASAMTFDMSGTARGTDHNDDRVVDMIAHGLWTGTLQYGTAAPNALSSIADSAKFTGAVDTLE